MRIETQTEFEVWLDSNFWLEDAIINTLELYPKTVSANGSEEPPSKVRLGCALQVGGSYEAGKTRWMRDIEIIAQGVKHYSIGLAEGFIVGNCCQGIEIINVEQGVGFTLDVPGILKLVCTSIDALQYPDREELVEPWHSSNEFFARATLQTYPPPADWVTHFHRRGWDVVWRYHYGDERAIEEVPVDYTGWFLQLRSRLNENPQGLFFQHCQLERETFSLHLVNYDQALQRLWIEAGKYVATFPELSISCGNTTMNQAEWLAHLAQFDT